MMPKSDILAFVLRGKNRIKILQTLNDGEKISAQIEKQTAMYKSHISRALKELQTYRLIRCTNPKDRNFKFYELTDQGKKVLAEANKILDQIDRP